MRGGTLYDGDPPVHDVWTTPARRTHHALRHQLPRPVVVVGVRVNGERRVVVVV